MGFKNLPQEDYPEVPNLLIFKFFNAFYHCLPLYTWPCYSFFHEVDLKYLEQGMSEISERKKISEKSVINLNLVVIAQTPASLSPLITLLDIFWLHHDFHMGDKNYLYWVFWVVVPKFGNLLEN